MKAYECKIVLCRTCWRTALGKDDFNFDVEEFDYDDGVDYSCGNCGIDLKEQKALEAEKISKGLEPTWTLWLTNNNQYLITSTTISGVPPETALFIANELGMIESFSDALFTIEGHDHDKCMAGYLEEMNNNE